MKIRFHKGLSSEAMEALEKIDNTKQAVFDYLLRQSTHWEKDFSPKDINVLLYSIRGVWAKTYIVLVKNIPVAFCSEGVQS